MIHSFHLNEEEELRFRKIVDQQKEKSESAIIRERLFRKRERNQVKIDVIDLTFLSTVSNLISCIGDNYGRGNSIREELQELKQVVDDKLNNG